MLPGCGVRCYVPAKTLSSGRFGTLRFRPPGSGVVPNLPHGPLLRPTGGETGGAPPRGGRKRVNENSLRAMSTADDALVKSIGTSLVEEPAVAPQHSAPQHPSSRSLWIGGLSAEVSDELLQSRLEDVRGRAATAHGSSAGWRDYGTFAVRRMLESSGAWVDFTSPALAQEVITVLNGSTIGPGMPPPRAPTNPGPADRAPGRSPSYSHACASPWAGSTSGWSARAATLC